MTDWAGDKAEKIVTEYYRKVRSDEPQTITGDIAAALREADERGAERCSETTLGTEAAKGARCETADSGYPQNAAGAAGRREDECS